MPLLEGLRDIHLPDAVSPWPPAPGWWLLLAVLLTAAWVLFKYLRAPKRRARRRALTELGRLERVFEQDEDTRALLSALSQLVRRYALACFPRDQVSGLEGNDWLEFLDRSGATTVFSRGPGRALATAPYQQDPHVDTGALLAAAREWIARCPKTRSTMQ